MPVHMSKNELMQHKQGGHAARCTDEQAMGVSRTAAQLQMNHIMRANETVRIACILRCHLAPDDTGVLDDSHPLFYISSRDVIVFNIFL